MIISLNWLKKYTDITVPVDELATLIGARLVEIEEVQDISRKYDGVVLARVVSCVPVPDSDHLNLTKLDDGGVVKNVERDENGHVQVVCGAPNVREGLLVVWLPPGVTVPSTFNDVEPFVLGARKLRGEMSNGMIASAKELDLYDDHTGIVEVMGDYAAGASFSEVCSLDDVLLDIENKSLTHRPDTFGIIGFAREVAAIQGLKFETPAWLTQTKSNEKTVTQGVTIEDKTLSSRYTGIVLESVNPKASSSLELQTWLARVGVRPINQVVDVTNYLMMLTGQPLHAFDYEKLLAVNNGALDIRVRAGKGEGDELTLLDGRTVTLSENDIVIANGEKAVALAGAMGGSATEVDETTTSIFLESASFNLFNLRATQMRHGIFSEAITRFTKGQSSEQSLPVLRQAVELYHAQGATVLGDIIDVYAEVQQPVQITIALAQIQQTLGDTVSLDEVKTILERVNCTVESNGDTSIVDVPYWRADLHIAEDIIEEVGRIRGFDSITPTLAARDFTAVRPSRFDTLRAAVRRRLVVAGANELLTYSFVHGDILKKAGQDPANSYRITNSISPDLQYYRQSLTPSLLQNVHPNLKAGFDDFALFEINKVHRKDAGLTDEGVPVEHTHLGFVVAHKKNDDAAVSYYSAKRYLDYLARHFALTVTYKELVDNSSSLAAPFEPRRSAAVYMGEERIGVVGEYKRAVAKAFKLPERVAGFEIDLEKFAVVAKKASVTYAPLSKYPSVERDICFAVSSDVSYASLYASVAGVQFDNDIVCEIEARDIFARNETTKNITFRLRFTPYHKTLNGNEIAELVERVAAAANASTQAQVV